MRRITFISIISAGILAIPAFAQVYIADSKDNVIRVVNSTGIIGTVAGNGIGGYIPPGDGVAATSARLNIPYGIAVGGSGDLYIADTVNNRVRRVNHTTSVITTLAGNGAPSYTGNGGLATSAGLNHPTGVAVGSSGDVYIADEYNNAIRKVDHTTGIITTVAGTGAVGSSGDGGLATGARLYYPTGLAVGASGDLYIADTLNNRIRKVDHTTGIITTVAGNGTVGYKGCPSGIATSAQLYSPTGVALDGKGNLYIADQYDLCVRKVDTTGNISTLAGTGFSTTYNPPGDGSLAVKVGLNYPTGVAVDGSGNVYIADDDNNSVRKVNTAGIITTFAGSGLPGCSPASPGDGGSAVTAKLCNPTGVAVPAAAPVPVGSCQGSSSLSTLVSPSGTNVTAYIPKGNWSVTPTTGIAVVDVEGSGVVPTTNPIPTTDIVNSCASNPVTNTTVCTANSNKVYLIPGGTATPTVTTLTSAGTGSLGFSGGTCTNCGVSMDAVNNRAVIGLALASAAGFQFLDLNTNIFGTPFVSPAGYISEDPLLDPVNNVLLSADESGNFEIIDTSTISPPTLLPTKFYENATGGGELDSSAEDCSTRIALAPNEDSYNPSMVFFADLSQVTLTPGSPGTWTAPSVVQGVTGSVFVYPTGSAVAQGTHTAVVTPEFGGNGVTAIQLPATSSSGTPAIGPAWETCYINGFSMGYDPHTMTAYKSPNGGDAIAVLANGGATTLERVDLTMMLTLPSATTTHQCTAAEMVTFNATMVTTFPIP
jgi:sugar lactone lactonase YvrE